MDFTRNVMNRWSYAQPSYFLNSKVLMPLLLVMLGYFAHAQEKPDFLWATHFSGDNSCQGNGIATDASGYVYTTGWFRGSMDFDPDPKGTNILKASGREDVFVTKQDPSGKLVWAKGFGGDMSEQGLALSVGADGFVYLTGFFQATVDFDPNTPVLSLTASGARSIFVSKFNTAGTLVWARDFGMVPLKEDGLGTGYGVAADAQGNVFVTGSFSGKIDVNPSTTVTLLSENPASNKLSDIFVVALSSAGAYKWAKAIGGVSADGGDAVALDAAGDVYVTGLFGDKVIFDTDLGGTQLSSNASNDIFVMKMNGGKGNLIWAVNMGGDVTGGVNDEGRGIAVDGSQNVYTTGHFAGKADFDPGSTVYTLTSGGSTDIYVSKLDPLGKFVWAKAFAGEGADRGHGIALDKSGNVFTTGYFQYSADFDPSTKEYKLTATGGNNIFVSKLDNNGNFLWASSFGTGGDQGQAIATDPSLNVLTTGFFLDKTDFDPGTAEYVLTPELGQNAFVQKLASEPDGLVITSQPVADRVCEGAIASFNIKANGSNVKYQWQVYNTKLLTFANLTESKAFVGTTTPSLSITASSTNLSGTYRCLLSDDKTPSLASNTVTLTVDHRPSPTSAVVGDTVCGNVGAQVSIAGTVSGDTYRAYRNGQLVSSAVVSAGGTLTLSITATALAMGVNKLVVTGSSARCLTSLNDTATVLVNKVPDPYLPIVGDTICSNVTSAKITIVRGEAGVMYSAYLAGKLIGQGIGNGTSATITIPTGTLATGNNSFALSTTLLGCGENGMKDPANVRLNTVPAAPNAFSNSPICAGNDLYLGAKLPIKASYSWTGPNGFTSKKVNDTIPNATVLASGTYVLTAVLGGCANATKIAVIVNPIPTTPTNIVGTFAVCQGVKGYTYSVKDAGTSYVWSYTGSGVTINNGGKSDITIDYSNIATSGALLVNAIANNCASAVVRQSIVVNVPPTTQGSKTTLVVCEGDPILLSAVAVGNSTYAWSNAASGFTSTLRNPTIKEATLKDGGNYVVTLTENGCVGDKDTTVVTVNPKPSAAFAYPKVSYCQDSPNASPLSLPVGSVFSARPASLALDSKSGTVYFPKSDTVAYVITNTVTNTFKCSNTSTFTLTVFAKPVAPVILGACQSVNPPTPLSVNLRSGQAITWFKNGAVFGTGSPISATSTGIYKAVVTKNGCNSDTSSVDPFITKPTISPKGPFTLCSGDSIVLNSSSSSGNLWKEATTGKVISNLAKVVLKASAKVYLDVTNGNCTGRDSSTVTVNNRPPVATIAGNDSLCPGGSVQLSFVGTFQPQLQWVKDGVDLKDSTKTTLRVTQAGAYQLKTIAANCSATSAVKNVGVYKTSFPVLNYKGSQTICKGASLELTITNFVSGQDQWYLNNAPMTSTDGKLQTIKATVDKGVYHVVRATTRGGCPTISEAVTLNMISVTPTVSFKAAQKDSICVNLPVAYVAQSTNGGPIPVYEWFVNNKKVTAASDTLRLAGLSATSKIKVALSSSATCAIPKQVFDSVLTPVATRFQVKTTVTQLGCVTPAKIDFTLSPVKTTYTFTGDLKAAQNQVTVAKTYAVKITDSKTQCGLDTTITVQKVVPPPLTTKVSRVTISLCEGATLQLQSNLMGVEYAWTGPAFSSNLANPSIANATVARSGRYILTYASGDCTGDKDTTDVVVNTLPKSVVVYPKSTFCEGDAPVSPQSVPVGSFYSASPTGLALSGTLGTIQLASSAKGAYVIKNVVTNSAGCKDSTTFRLSVTERPETPTINGACQSATPPVTLTVAVPNQAYTYRWFKDKALLGTGVSVNATTIGTYKAVAATSAGCTSDTSSIDPFITKPEIRIVSGTSTFCVGDSVRLFSNASTGIIWTNAISGASLGTSQTLTIKTTTKVYLDITNGRCTGRDSMAITVNVKPSVPIVSTSSDSLCPKGALVLSTSATSVQWIKDGADVKDSTNGSLTVTAPGVYQVRTTISGCSSVSALQTIVFRNTSTPLLDTKGTVQICQGTAIDLKNTTFLAGQDQWYISNQPINNTEGRSASVKASLAEGRYKVVRTSKGGCVTVSDSVLLKTFPSVTPLLEMVAIPATPVCANVPVLYVAKAKNVGSSPSFEWFVNSIRTTNTTDSLTLSGLAQTSKVEVIVHSSATCANPATADTAVTTTIVPRFQVKTVVVPIGCSTPGEINFNITPVGNNYVFSGDLQKAANKVTTASAYKVRISDPTTQCALDTTIIINRTSPFTVNAVLENPTCWNKDGAINLGIQPANGSYSVVGDTLKSFTTNNLEPKRYKATIKDNTSGCSIDTSFVLLAIGRFATAIDVTPAGCGASDGIVRITPSPAGVYNYSGDLIAAVTSNLAPKTYVVNVASAKCAKYDTVVVWAKANFKLEAKVVQPTCKQLGSIVLSTMPAVKLTISGALNALDNQSLSPGTYAVTLKDDATGCQKDSIITLRDPAFRLTPVVVHPTCLAKGSILIRTTPRVPFVVTGDIKDSNTTNLVSGLYTVRITDTTTKCAKDTVIVLNPLDFKIGAKVTQPSCSGRGRIQLSTLPSFNFKVTGALTTADSANLQGGIYRVFITNPQTQCSKDTTILLNNVQSYALHLRTRDTTLCAGVGFSPVYTLSPQTPLPSYLWTKKGATFSTLAKPTLSDSGVYVLQVAGTGMCTAKDSVHVRTKASPTANAGPDIKTCYDTAMINAPSGQTGRWRQIGTTATLLTPDSPTSIVHDLLPYDSSINRRSNQFEWTVSNGGCSKSDTVDVFYSIVVIAITDIDSGFAGDVISKKVLINDKYSLGDKLFIQKGRYGTLGSPIDSIQIQGDTLIKFFTKPKVIGSDFIVYRLKNQCSATDSAKVIVKTKNSPPVPQLISKSTTVGTKITEKIPVHLIDRNANIKHIEVSSLSGAVATFAYDTLAEELAFTVDYSNVPDFAGTDQVQFRIYDESGAFADLVFKVEVSSDLKIYNAISPNGDGIHDFFEMEGIRQYPDNKLDVFNRWGDKVFYASGYDNVKNTFDGKNLPDGTYYYVLQLGKDRKTLEGYIVLKR